MKETFQLSRWVPPLLSRMLIVLAIPAVTGASALVNYLGPLLPCISAAELRWLQVTISLGTALLLSLVVLLDLLIYIRRQKSKQPPPERRAAKW